jgi:hypothetical protein
MTTEERIEAMFQRTEEIHAHLVGTMDRRGLTRRVEDLERTARTSWLRERGTKALDALILGTVVTLVLLILSAGTKAVLRDVVSIQVSSRETRKPPIPMPAECKGCKDAVIPSRVGWADEER